MKKILIIDDDQELTSLLKELLELENYDTSIASNGEEGLKKYTEDIDLILLDVMMPVLNGFDTLKRFRDKLNVITPILMLTAKGDEIDKVMGLDVVFLDLTWRFEYIYTFDIFVIIALAIEFKGNTWN